MPLPVRVGLWWNRMVCDHHWHPVDPMIGWACCWCGKETDGGPGDRTNVCAYEWTPT